MTFKGGKVINIATAMSGILEVATVHGKDISGADVKAVKFDYIEFVKQSKESNKAAGMKEIADGTVLKPGDPGIMLAITNGMNMGIATSFANAADVKKYHWYQQDKITSTGKDTTNLPNNNWEDDHGKEYPFADQNETAKLTLITDTPHFAGGWNYPRDLIKEEKTDDTIKSVTLNVLDNKTYETKRDKFNKKMSDNNTVIKFEYTTTLIANATSNALGKWEWGFTLSFPNGQSEVKIVTPPQWIPNR